MTEQDKVQAPGREESTTGLPAPDKEQTSDQPAPRFAHKKIFGFDYDDSDTIKLLIYLVIGGTAALFEWGLFWLFNHYAGIHYEAATALAFLCSTIFHYFLGNIFVFNSGARYQKGTEITLVLLVSAIGLGFNLLLMYIFVGLCGWHPMLSKMLASAIVVVWNYLSRKKWIFKES
jgi:putative flippase GtrA